MPKADRSCGATLPRPRSLTTTRTGPHDLPALHITTAAEWRAWLKANHRRAAGVWLIYYKRQTGKPRIPYRDALEEAICFGWIDAMVRSIDAERYAQKWTPRRPGSGWSDINQSLAQKLIRQRRMTKAGLDALGPDPARPRQAKTWARVTTVPDDLLAALRRSKKAQNFFDALAPSYRARYLAWIEEAKLAETRKKRIARVVELLAQGVKSSMS